MIHQVLTSETIDLLGWILVHSLWQFTLIAVAGVALQWGLNRSSAALRYCGLLFLLAAIVAAPVITWCWLVNGPSNPPSEVVTADPIDQQQNLIIPVTNAQTISPAEPEHIPLTVKPALNDPNSIEAEAVPEAMVESQSSTWPTVIAHVLQPWFPVLVFMWCLGVVLFALRPIVSWFTIRRLRSVGTYLVPEPVQSLFNKSVQRLGVRKSVEVLQSTLVQVPVVVGYWRPVVLLPASLITGLPANQLEAILTHELAHIRRHDYLFNLAQVLVETLFFYHPAVWWLSRRIRAERENCCDDLVVAALGNRVEYGRALCWLLRNCRGEDPHSY